MSARRKQTMKTIFAAIAAIALSSSMALAASKPIVPATVLENVPTTTPYSWGAIGQNRVNCLGLSCDKYYSSTWGGTNAVSGAVVKLLLTDGRIVVVGCSMKPDNGRNVALILSGVHASPIYRSCRVPIFGADVSVQFDGNNAKLFMQEPSIDGTGKAYTETYQIVGVFEPAPQP